MVWLALRRNETSPIPLRYWVGVAANGVLWCVALGIWLSGGEQTVPLESLFFFAPYFLLAFLASATVSLGARRFFHRASLTRAVTGTPLLLFLGLFLGTTVLLATGIAVTPTGEPTSWIVAMFALPIGLAIRGWWVFIPAAFLSVAMMWWFAREPRASASFTEEPPRPPQPGMS
jgi:hypothetical protein